MATTENKMTKRKFLEEIKTLLANNTDIVKFCNNEITLLDNKAKKSI